MAKDTSKNIEPRDVRIAKINMLQAIIVALIGVLGAGMTGYLAGKDKEPYVSNVVPAVNAKSVPELPSPTSIQNFQLLKDISIFDLRSWKPVPANSKDNERISPVNFINYIHVKKLKPIEKFTAHYSTTGFGIDMRCITHNATILKEENPKFHDGNMLSEYAVEVDISEIPVNQEFLIVIEATYWNGFKNTTTETASTYTHKRVEELGELALIVLLPQEKPFKNYTLYRQQGNDAEQRYRSNVGNFYADETNRFLYWSIGKITPETHYKISWDW